MKRNEGKNVTQKSFYCFEQKVFNIKVVFNKVFHNKKFKYLVSFFRLCITTNRYFCFLKINFFCLKIAKFE